MSQKLTMRPAGSTDSSSSDISSSDEFESQSQAPGKQQFAAGVFRGIKRLGGGRERPTGPQVVDTRRPTASSGSVSTPIELKKSENLALEQHVRSISNTANREKPLPKCPFSPPGDSSSDQGTLSPLDTPRPTFAMTTDKSSDSRTSTMDSSTSELATQPFGNKAIANASTYQSDKNDSQVSFASQGGREREDDEKDLDTPRSAIPSSAGPSPAPQLRATTVLSSTAIPGSSSTQLSGLMCNVHRTTGREPHALVGATTTILGDKLYVFGGKILSRTRAALTSDLYELDLIRRHWTKLEASGDIPPPRYFHSMCALGDTKLVCYGGMSPVPLPLGGSGQSSSAASSQSGQDMQPEVVVMSDIHIYDASTNSWAFIPTQDTPQGRYAHCATILPSSATFSSANAPLSALIHNPSSSNPNQGIIGVNIDGTGGAEMVVVGGQDSANHYIEQISVFNLRSLKWTSTQKLGKSCGAYRSVVAPLPGYIASRIGKSPPVKPEHATTGISQEAKEPGSSMLIYSNYNFLDVKLELQVRSADGTLVEKAMQGTFTPPGLRFPNGGVIDTNFVVSGTYLTSSKQEYALWALDLRNLTWSRIDAGGTVFSQGSWNRGILWSRRNTFVILGNRRRSLVEDYNHRRLNFSNVCMVELEAFGLYDNPRKSAPMSGFISSSAPAPTGPLPALPTKLSVWNAGGRTLSKAAEELGTTALGLRELADMDFLAVGGERIPVNSRIIARRWGPYFVQLLREGAATQDGNDSATLRPAHPSMNPSSLFAPSHNHSRNSSITITQFSSHMSNLSTSSTLNDGSSESTSAAVSRQNQDQSVINSSNFLSPPEAQSLLPTSRPRTLYLPHTYLTLQSLIYYLYTSSLPPPSSALCTPQILCSLLQLARPYRIDGLVEVVVERLHSILDSRNAAAVFNAAAMAAGGGRSLLTSPFSTFDEQTEESSGQSSDNVPRAREGLRITTSFGNRARPNVDSEDEDEANSALSSSASSTWDGSESGAGSERASRRGRAHREVWGGNISCVIGLQKRGLRGLMEGRRLRERGASVGKEGTVRVGLGIA